ncbi:MAG TPA: NAD-dependent epimerase/dehydratase family protein [Acidimicrobiia bacterium]
MVGDLLLERPLTVAVTGPTGTFGFGLMPLLEADDRIRRVIGIARRPFDPVEHGWTKMEYRRGDVRDAAALDAALDGADVVVHLAFLITGNASSDTIRSINVDGTLNTFDAAARTATVQRFVYASSVAAYGFHRDNPARISEDWPTRPARRLFYAREKAEIEQLLAEASARHPDVGLYVLRPPIVLGPHAVGAKRVVPAPLDRIGAALGRAALRLPLPLPVPVPDLPLQLIHERDVGQAFLQCIVGAGPPGAYNIAGSGVVTPLDAAREIGLMPVRVPYALVRTAARAVAAIPLPLPQVGWVEVAAQPAVVDTAKAERELGWTPRYSALDSLRATLASVRGPINSGFSRS